MNVDQYLSTFIDETRESLQFMNEYLLKLEQDFNNVDILNDIFRVIHTIKGMSATMGYENTAKLTHQMENVLDLMRNRKIIPDSDTLDLLFSCLDRLENLLNQIIQDNNDNWDNRDLLDKLDEMAANNDKHRHGSTLKNVAVDTQVVFNEFEIAVLGEARSRGKSLYDLTISLEKECVLPAARAFMVEKAIESCGEIIKSIPGTEELENGDFEGSFRLFFITDSDKDYLKLQIEEIPEVDNVVIAEIDETLKISEKQDAQVALDIEEDNLIVAEKEQTQEKNNHSQQKGHNTIRVSAERLDKLMNLVGELVINKTRVEQIVHEKQYLSLPNSLGLMGTVTNDIQEIVMKLRMIPIANVFNRFPRLVRDISRDLGKQVKLELKGQDTEMDRAVIEELGDPLVHLIRNSLDHGLETTEERIQKGKPEVGLLELSAYNEGDSIYIKIKDDGKGLNTEKIAKKALEKGLVTDETLKAMSDQDLKELIFLPAFSTHDVATDLSGRGVGMDVVNTKISSLGGSVYLESEKDKGTIVTIRLPSTIVILQALLVNVDTETYAIPLNNINEVIDINVDEIHSIQSQEVMLLRGRTLPLFRMDRLLDVKNKDNDQKTLTVVLVQASEKSVGLVVSDLVGQKEVVIKPINKKLSKADYFSGATTLGNGEVALILNVNGLVKN